MNTRDADDRLICKAPKGQFRVTGYDSFDHDDWFIGDYKSLEKAQKAAAVEPGQQMTLKYIWDDKGKQVGKAGSW